MPNGGDKNLVRLYEVVNGFRGKHSLWPTRARMPAACLEDLRDHVLTSDGWKSLNSRLELVTDDDRFAAEDDEGRQYVYLSSGRPAHGRAEEWLDIQQHVKPGLF